MNDINRTVRHTAEADATGNGAEDLPLFERFLAGDDAAFHAFFRRHNRMLLTYCMKMVEDFPAAEDMVQEAWIRMIDLRARPSDAAIRNPVGFLVRVARNLCLDYRKSRKRLLSLGEEPEFPSSAYTMPEATADEEIVEGCMKMLPFEYRETLVLNVHCGYSLEEIARMLDKSPDAIWARASRARKKLRELVTAGIEREEGRLRVITKKRKERG